VHLIDIYSGTLNYSSWCSHSKNTLQTFYTINKYLLYLITIQLYNFHLKNKNEQSFIKPIKSKLHYTRIYLYLILILIIVCNNRPKCIEPTC
jgi:hypothetical protein